MIQFVIAHLGAFFVVTFPRDKVAHSALGIFYITIAPRNEVHVNMGDRLPSGRSIVHANIEAFDGWISLD